MTTQTTQTTSSPFQAELDKPFPSWEVVNKIFYGNDIPLKHKTLIDVINRINLYQINTAALTGNPFDFLSKVEANTLAFEEIYNDKGSFYTNSNKVFSDAIGSIGGFVPLRRTMYWGLNKNNRYYYKIIDALVNMIRYIESQTTTEEESDS